MTDFAALHRLMSGSDPLDVLRYQEQRRKPRQVEEVPDIPTDPVEFVKKWVVWPHISEFGPDGSPRPVGGDELNSMQLDYLERRTAFRYDAEGQPVTGSDIVCKSRRVRFSSLCYALILHTLLRLPGVSALSVYQAQKAALLEGAIDQILYALRRLPRQWLGLNEGEDPSVLRVGYRLRFRNGSRYTLDTAGQHARVSNTLGRGMSSLQILHLTEPRAYHEPEIVFAAAGKAVGPRGWIVAESNPPTSRTAWMAEEYMLTEQDPPSGSFRRAFFWPWYQDPLKRIARGTPGFDAMHLPKFVDTLPEGTVKKEAELGLDPEQVAFRRRERFTGTAHTRTLNLAENPESVSESFSETANYWLDRGALELCRAQCCDPIYRERLGTMHSVSLWIEPEAFTALGEMLICMVDTASKHGVDRSAAVFRSAITRTYVGEIHGKCLPSEMADSICWVLERFVGGPKRAGRFLVAVERNAGTGRDLLDHLQNKKGIPVSTRCGLYAESIADTRPSAKGRKKLRPGLWSNSQARASFLAALSEGVEGRGFDAETGEVLPLGPTVPYRSKYLVDELENLALHEGLIQAPPGHHDDLAIADAACLMLCSRVGRKLYSGGIQMGGTRGGLTRQGKKVRRSRRKLRPI